MRGVRCTSAPVPLLHGLGGAQKDVAPTLGGSVQVLHADGNWYSGKLTEFDETKGRWHILFEDGDRDWYVLPDRDVRILRERATGSWASYLKRYSGMRPTTARDQLREVFLACQPSEPAPPRKPADLFVDGAQLHNPNPGITLARDAEIQWPGQGLSASKYISGDFRISTAFSGAGPHKRRRGYIQLPDHVKETPESELYCQLLEIERRLDAAVSRQTLDIEDILKDPPTHSLVVQLCLYNTYRSQPSRARSGADGNDVMNVTMLNNSDSAEGDLDGMNPSWTLFVSGRIISENVETKEHTESFSELFENISFELPSDQFSANNIVSWDRDKSGDSKPQGFKMIRDGSQECTIKVRLHRWRAKSRYSLSSPELASLLCFSSGTLKMLLLSFWNYAKQNGLQEDRDTLYIRLDDPLQKIFKESRIPLARVLERLKGFAVEVPPVELEYRVQLGQGGNGCSPTTVVEFEVACEDSMAGKWREYLHGSEGSKEISSKCAELDRDISELIEEIEVHKRKRDFMKRIGDQPLDALQKVSDALALDLGSIRSDSSGPYCALPAEESRRFKFWQEPWVEEASLHYLWSQGYDVPQHLEASLLEEDAAAFAHSAVSVATVAAHALTATTLPPLRPQSGTKSAPISIGTRVWGDNDVYCATCKQHFITPEALQAHIASAPAHKEDCDQRRLASWFPNAPPATSTPYVAAPMNAFSQSFAQVPGQLPTQFPTQSPSQMQYYSPAHQQVQPAQLATPQPGQVQVQASPQLPAQQPTQLSFQPMQQQGQPVRTSYQPITPTQQPQKSAVQGSNQQQQTLWNQIQKEARGKGISMEQMREMYKKRLEEQKQQQQR